MSALEQGLLSPRRKDERACLKTTTGGLAVFVLGGLVFGFNSLKPIMFERGVFSDKCQDTADADVQAAARNLESACADQTEWIDLMYDASIFFLSFIMIFFGSFQVTFSPDPF